MIRQTGGFARGATSTRSRSMVRAIVSASGRVLIPTWLPSAPIRRTSRARMRSLYRGSFCCGVAMAVHSCAMGCSPCSMVVVTDAKPRNEQPPARTREVIRCRDPGAPVLQIGGRVGVVHGCAPLRLSCRLGRLAHVDEETSNTQVDDALQAMEDVRRQLIDVPAEVVVTNHVMGLYELAAIHLSATPPDLRQAVLAIDAVACLVEGLGDRLGAEEPTLRDALANIRLAFVQIKGQQQRAQQPAPADATSAADEQQQEA